MCTVIYVSSSLLSLSEKIGEFFFLKFIFSFIENLIWFGPRVEEANLDDSYNMYCKVLRNQHQSIIFIGTKFLLCYHFLYLFCYIWHPTHYYIECILGSIFSLWYDIYSLSHKIYSITPRSTHYHIRSTYN